MSDLIKSTVDLEGFQQTRLNMLESLVQLAEGLEDQSKNEIQKLLKNINPRKKGLDEVNERWTIATVRVIQNSTQNKPPNSRPGDLYTDAGLVIPQPLLVAPIYAYQFNRMFPPGGGTGAPVCMSPDAKLGNTFGECAKCANRPMFQNATGAQTDCSNGYCFIVLSQDMRIYRIEFANTSRKAGTNMYKAASTAGENIWDRWINIETSSQSGKRGSWSVFQTSLGNETPEHVRAACDTIFDLVEADRKLFLQNHYASAVKSQEAIEQVDEQVDMEALQGEPDLASEPDMTNSGI